MEERDQQTLAEVRRYLTQIALELEAAAQGAREAARLLPDPRESWPQVHQMYARLEQATGLVTQFQRRINEVVQDGAKIPAQFQRSQDGAKIPT